MKNSIYFKSSTSLTKLYHKKNCILIVTIIFLIFFGLQYCCENIFNDGIKSVIIKDRKISPIKYVLLWTSFFSNKNWIHYDTNATTIGEDYFRKKGCKYTNCIFTINRTLLKNIYEYDAVVFHGAEKNLSNEYPKYRSPHQRYIMASITPPSTLNILETNFYNLTMSYKLGSDIMWVNAFAFDKITMQPIAPSEYPHWRKMEPNFNNEIMQKIKKRSKMAVTILSDYTENSKSFKLFKMILKYIPVDDYGPGGKQKCLSSVTECAKKFDSYYNFFLIFEDTFCADYISDTFFTALHYTMIPIVYGASNYSKWAPPHSYIDVNDYNSVKDLTTYLIYLESNPEEYAKYFWWKKYYEFYGRPTFCQICDKLNEYDKYKENSKKIETYHDILQWYSADCNDNTKIKLE